MMNIDRIVFGVTFCAFITVAGVLHANIGKPSQTSVLNHIEVMERAVSNSSVTRLYSPEQQQQLSALVKEAKVLYLTGDYKTATYQIEQLVRQLYPMKPTADIPLKGEKQIEWLDQMGRVISALIPVAEDIADEKGMGKEFIHHSSTLYIQGRSAQAEGDIYEAERLLTDAYNALQSAVLMLRSGDNLVIEQPAAGSESAWLDAERRYQDWRYFADWMAQTSAQLDIDPALVEQGSVAADSLYQQAQANADKADWLQAMKHIDQAYLTMETYWRQAGIDI